MSAFAAIALSLASAALVFTLVLAARRLRLARRERAKAEALSRLRPLALELIEGNPEALPELHESDARAFAGVLARYARTVRGFSRERITDFFEEHGHVEHELGALRDRREWRRAAAAHALGDMGSERAAPGLLKALDDRSRDVRSAAARSLGRLGAAEAVEGIVQDLANGDIPHAIAGQSLLEIGPAALPALRSLLGEAADEGGAAAISTRAVTVELIGLLGGAEDARLVQDRLRDVSPEVREQAARALGRLGANEGALELRNALADRIPVVRAAAAQALGMIRDHDAVDALLAQARDDEFEPAQAAATALAAIDPGRLTATAREPDSGPHVQEAADLVEIS